jgi:hypothetical protein
MQRLIIALKHAATIYDHMDQISPKTTMVLDFIGRSDGRQTLFPPSPLPNRLIRYLQRIDPI